MNNYAKMFIFLHGYNSNGDAMKILDSVFKKNENKNSVFLYPNAPFKVNNGDGYCWFQFVFGDDPFSINEKYVFDSMQLSMPYLSKYIDNQLIEYPQFAYKDIVLIGFSQGAGLALHASMFLKNKICCTVSFSGGLANPDNIISKNKINKSPMLLIHGYDDQILPYQFSQRGYHMLKKENFDAELHLLKDTKHIITPDAMDIAKNFIGRY